MMTRFINSETLKLATENLRAVQCNPSFIDYIIVRAANIYQGNGGVVVVSGRTLEPNTKKAKFVYGTTDDANAPYFNPLNGDLLSSRHWTNGPSDTVPRWSAREHSPLTTITDASAKSKTVRLNDFNAEELRAFFGMAENDRPALDEFAIWWYRATDLDSLEVDSETDIKAALLCNCFLNEIGLSQEESAEIFKFPDEQSLCRVIPCESSVAAPENYIVPYKELISTPKLNFINQPRNLIYFGAPGTGKSYQLNRLAVGDGEEAGLFTKDNVWRVTFHPDYTYSQFVGCFKPYSNNRALEEQSSLKPDFKFTVSMDKTQGGPALEYDGRAFSRSSIEYKFVAGPFLEIYAEAVNHPSNNYLLIIEEINRANPAAVFGDVFQLLDRDEDGRSEYAVAAPLEVRDWLKQEKGIESNDELSLPPNLYLWATMNSADQGVFPMDTAFKRRWDFRYMGIDAGEDLLRGITVRLGKDGRRAYWNDVRKSINDLLLKSGVNEDKLLGPFFVRPADLKDEARFPDVFKDKVLLYLYEDACRTRHQQVFSGKTYSTVCSEFDENGLKAFNGIEEPTYVNDAIETSDDAE